MDKKLKKVWCIIYDTLPLKGLKIHKVETTNFFTFFVYVLLHCEKNLKVAIDNSLQNLLLRIPRKQNSKSVKKYDLQPIINSKFLLRTTVQTTVTIIIKSYRFFTYDFINFSIKYIRLILHHLFTFLFTNPLTPKITDFLTRFWPLLPKRKREYIMTKPCMFNNFVSPLSIYEVKITLPCTGKPIWRILLKKLPKI